MKPEKVVILGGGVAGMSAAHELIERGFEVVVLERRDIAGGKARSIPVSDNDDGGAGHELADRGVADIEHRLPGEHGFRFFPGFYKHVVDTMRRIPSFDGRPVADHLVATTRVGFTQYDQPTFVVPANFPQTPGDAGTVLRDILLAFGPITGLTPDDLAFFGSRIWQIMTSCEQRRLDEYESINWWDFIGAEERSPAYKKFLGDGITRSLVAAKARRASARTIGDIFTQLMLTIVNPTGGSTDRVLDGPTNLIWIDPWLSYLQSRGVEYHFNTEVQQILCAGDQVSGIVVSENGVRTVVRGDHYIAAVPLERMAVLVNDDLLAADASLANLRTLAPNVEWMNGVQYYLYRDIPEVHGHVIHIDSEWALTSISQFPFWRSVVPTMLACGHVKDIISVDVSDWTAPGPDGRPAMQCSRDEVARETWRQLKRSLNSEQEILRDEDLHSWFLDSDTQPDPTRPGFLANAEPLLVNLVDTWALRPEAATGLSNLFLASDYVRTHTDLATMEGANEAARRAVNSLLDAVAFAGPRCEVWPLQEVEVLTPWRLHDAARHRAGLPWDASLSQVALQALRAASPLLDQVAPLMAAVTPYATPVADALDAADQAVQRSGAGLGDDPAVRKGSAYVPAPLENVLRVTDRVPGSGDITGPGGFVERLAWYRGLITETLESGVPAWEPQSHLYALVKDFMSRSGKGLRPALCIATTRALGGRAEHALPAAAGIEMLHNAFLVHDDIEDGSESRRGVPTMHRRAGIPLAVNTGDAMNALAMRLMRRSGEFVGPAGTLRILDEIDHMLMETLEGQAMELGWVRDNDLSVGTDDYLRLALKKTAWYSFIHPLRIGALVANPEDPKLDRFDRFGYLLGLAFQITDDVLNLSGDESRYGKEIDGDLWEGKRTLVLTHALSHAGRSDRDWMSHFLSRPRERRLPREVLRLHDIVVGTGSIEWARQSAVALAEAAAQEFDASAFAGAAPGPDLDWLRASVDYLVQRDS
ncbi:FAD-dependent oxidoreductase [Variovorax saccharolyticus]|uniref:FAD-dependent oxidoreductase n=1 Tax=Variovorax saccharolyticus TaxID=3053516 RepID=UPI0025764BA4|nr:FAD-dependent oxidoreductase [Variovorax sp. J31P216]MDM0023187.1 FAD-dependent oxidoreductase [Variovorax sp. J31P216]